MLCIGLGGFFFFTFENTVFRGILILAAILPLIISQFIKSDNKKQLLCQSASAVLLASFLLSYLYFDKWFKAYDLYEDEVNVEGTVESYAMSNSYTKRLLVKVDKINGQRRIGYKFYAYVPSKDAKDIIYGTKINFDARLTGFSDESKSYNFSKGINAYASDVENIKIISYSSGGISETFSYYREILTRYTIMISDSQTGALLSALLLGERDYLPDQLRLDFKRIGISHILALSGMHLAILSLGIGKLLSAFGIRKKSRLAIISVFVLIYMALTGFSVSVVRAGIMLIISSCLFILGKTKDSLTSLTVAVFIICLINPNAVFDISLQLSAFATFGIIAFSEYSNQANLMKNQGSFVKYVVTSIVASVFAISATLLISTASFGGFSVISPIATLLFSFIVEIAMYLGCVMLLIGAFIPIGRLLSPICSLITSLAGFLSSNELVYASTDFQISEIAILIYTVLFALFMVLKIKKIQKAFVILMVSFAAVLIIPTVSTAIYDTVDTVSYHSEPKSDEILIRSDGEVCLINSAQYSKSLAYSSIEFLEEYKVTYLDKYYITHYSWSLDDDFDVLLSNFLVEAIYLPAPCNEDEETILKLVYKATEDYRTEVYTVNSNEVVTVGEYKIKLLYSAPYGETSVNAFSVSNESYTYTYLSSGMLLLENGFNFNNVLSNSDCIIFGMHGKKYKEKIVLEEYFNKADRIVINSDNLTISDYYTDMFINNGCDIIISPDNSISILK